MSWARYETVRGKGSAVNCMICGGRPGITEKGFVDGTISFTITCARCWNRYFKDPNVTGISITVCSRNVYEAIRDWNRVNGAFLNGYKAAYTAVSEVLKGRWKNDDT